jgi:mRNA-degrading endonuclease RelE of RelBE toxin-antitoxin system
MTWTVQLTRTAVKQLRKLPLDTQQRIRRAIETLEKDPFAGDSKALKGAGWKGRYRKRVGRYCLIFILLSEPSTRRIIISAILPRSEKTYP